MPSASRPGPSPADAELIFPRGGVMGPLCRRVGWARTPLGPVEEWPLGLRTAAGLVLRQGIAMNLCWGPDLIQIYNDEYRAIMGDKHPEGLGRSVLWSWSEIAAEIEPLFARVLRGETVYFEDHGLRIRRHGALEDAYFTFSYSPVIDDAGMVGGALINCYETTDQVHARAVQAERDGLLDELRVERARLEYVFQRAPAFLAVLRGPDHVFDLANDAYFQLVGNRELLGKPVRAALPEVVGQGFVDLLDHVLHTGEPHVGRETAVELVRVPGEAPQQRFVDFSYLPLLEADGSRSGIIAHGTDVTDQVVARQQVERLLVESERARREAEAARAEAETANRAKADFLASMSHELRTPLNAIGGYVDLVDLGIHGPVTQAQHDALARVKASQQHLLTLINDVLAFAKVEAGQIELDLRLLTAREIVTSVEPLVAPLAEGKGVDLLIRGCDPSLRFMGDRERARQIVLNLAANAVKFTPAGGAIAMGCEETDGWVCISVSDDGPGIAPEKQRTIFDPFIQVDRRLSNPREGVGLGLAISRDLALAMGGELGVESVPGRGSTFTLRLPTA